ncbi:uncharacterized protein GLRG_09736 [Colletotrichum graminicola M1.001]|uniref:Helicase C-terminal domain-containing protein n=1 Tax=Colletotrichum graminicola (strain M1.001 / M2 / FGSC 10212) TaxID=645133 RepID=E3QUQ4_COLGM|nr:uncharacterized protein GLRG_09736 [Colletotrichum graminicola M1.001]EFQ34592.1 hypothetical protein GLRG_09736 [Colletotrichum graminicola M1.001]
MHTRLRLPDNTVTFPAKNLKPYKIVMEEMSFTEPDKNEVLAHSEALLKGTVMPGSRKKKSVKKRQASNANNDSFSDTESRSGGRYGGIGGNLGPACNLADRGTASRNEVGYQGVITTMREGMLVSFDVHNMVLQNVETDDAKALELVDDETIDAIVSKHARYGANGVSDTINTDACCQISPDQVGAAKPNDGNDEDIVNLGRGHVEYLIKSDPYGGLLHLFRVVTEDCDLPEPHNPFQLLKWVCSQSPILTRVLQLTYDVVRVERTRFFVLAQFPWQQQIIAAMLAIGGFNVESIRSCHSEAERSVSIERFTEAGSGVEVLVANTNISLNGLDLQDQCYNGAFVGVEWSINAHIQGAGRLVRVGQKHPVIFHMLKVKHTYYDYMERNMVSKWAEELLGFARLPNHINGWIRYACVHEIIRNYLHLDFNRLCWCDGIIQGDDISKYHATETVQRGHFYTFVAIWARSLSRAEYDEKLASWHWNLPEITNAYALKFISNVTEPLTYEDIVRLNLSEEVCQGLNAAMEIAMKGPVDESMAEKLKTRFERRKLDRQEAVSALNQEEDNDFIATDVNDAPKWFSSIETTQSSADHNQRAAFGLSRPEILDLPDDEDDPECALHTLTPKPGDGDIQALNSCSLRPHRGRGAHSEEYQVAAVEGHTSETDAISDSLDGKATKRLLEDGEVEISNPKKTKLSSI